MARGTLRSERVGSSMMANRMPFTPFYVGRPPSSTGVACVEWARSDADFMSARDIHDPTTEAVCMTAGTPPFVHPLAVEGESICAKVGRSCL